jgi:hypothetical protein
MSKEGKKRPVGSVGEDSDGLQGNLASLAGQIDFFESAATLVQSEPSVKKPALGVHSLTQNTTHGKIRSAKAAITVPPC